MGIFTVEWWKASGIRAVRTIVQTALSFISLGAAWSEIDWKKIVSVSIVAGIYCMLTSIAGLPEVEKKKENQ